MNLRRAYQVQRHNAKARDIGWKFTFDTWLNFWAESGRLAERGRNAKNYVMSRFNDEGPYAPGNCEIITQSDNMKQPQVQMKAAATRAKRPKDWKRADDYAHLRDRDNHPKARAVVCPDGIVYPSATQAAEAHGRTRAGISHRCKTGWGGWHFAD